MQTHRVSQTCINQITSRRRWVVDITVGGNITVSVCRIVPAVRVTGNPIPMERFRVTQPPYGHGGPWLDLVAARDNRRI